MHVRFTRTKTIILPFERFVNTFFEFFPKKIFLCVWHKYLVLIIQYLCKKRIFEKFEISSCFFLKNSVYYLLLLRGVAQFGRVPEWGSGGRWFESSHSDQFKQTLILIKN